MIHIIPKMLYKHYKGGVYKVIHEAKHTETNEILIIYYNISNPNKIWARPKCMFFEMIDDTTHRFTPLL